MKKLFGLFLVTVLALIVSCNKPEKTKDVVMDIAPMHRWDVHSQTMIDSLKSLPDSAKLPFIRDNAPNVLPTILARIEARVGKIHVDTIVFSYGSGTAKGVQDSAGMLHDGTYENQLIARIWTKPITKLGNPIIVFVRCLNGVIELHGDRRIGTESLGFYIEKGEGLAHHLPELEAWATTANNLNVPIKNKEGKITSHTTYINYLGRYESVLFEGDFVNLQEGKVFHDGREVDFNQRLADTKKANALAKKKAKKKHR